MKAIIFAWIAATTLGFGQQSDEEKKFYDDYAKSEQKTIAAYPDAANFDSPLSKKMIELEKALQALHDPRYNSADKPMILAEMAAKDLGIKPTAAAPSPPEASPPLVKTSEPLTPGSPEWQAKRDEAWKIFRDYYPEYCDPAIVESTYGFIREWDAWAKTNDPEVYKNPMKPLIYAKWQKSAEGKAQAERETQSAQDAEALRQRQIAALQSSDAAMQRVKDHYQQQQLDRQKQGEEMDVELKDQERERRLQKLEKAEHDRLNRERSPWGN